MSKLVNDDQGRSVKIVMRRFEESFHHAEDLLIDGESKGILFQREPVLPPGQYRAAQVLIGEANKYIAT
jgi:hypothetical protein